MLFLCSSRLISIVSFHAFYQPTHLPVLSSHLDLHACVNSLGWEKDALCCSVCGWLTGVQILTSLQPLDGLIVVMYVDEGSGRNYRSSLRSSCSLSILLCSFGLFCATFSPVVSDGICSIFNARQSLPLYFVRCLNWTVQCYHCWMQRSKAQRYEVVTVARIKIMLNELLLVIYYLSALCFY